MSAGAQNPKWEDVEQAMAACLELPEEQRSAYLSQQSASVRTEVESLLAAHRRAGGFLCDETGKPIAIAELLGKLKTMAAVVNSEPLAPGTRPAAKGSGGAGGSRPAISIDLGKQLGPYRIDTVIGKGGMGIVYRAVDTRLNRTVAVKFLFDDLADAASRRRFQREAQTASSLNHPHILTVHDAGDFEGRQYLVTEFVDGGTLRDWARAEKRTWREIVALLVGVADGLAAAHAAGILHRDIKPDNILVGNNGYAKLSDFGLAKLEEHTAPEAATQTLATRITRPGMIQGTIAYMSPEQASGRPTDARSDIFSFGIVLYELLAGRRPFEGATDLELLQTIIHGAAAPLNADVPLALRMVVEKALDRDPAERYQSARDLVVDLRRLSRQSTEASGSAGLPPVTPSPAQTKRTWKTGAVAAWIVTALLGGGTLLLWFQRPAAQAPRQALQFDISPPAETIFAPPIMRQPFAISPDGTRLALTATGPNGTHLWVRDLASLDMRAVPGTDGAESVFWSPDSRSIYYTVQRTLKQADLETGAGRSVVELPHRAQVGTWRSKGDLLLYLGGGINFYEVLVENGSLREAPVGKVNMRWPQFLPGGQRFVYVAESPNIRAMVSDYDSPKPVPLMETDSRVEYAPPRRPGEPAYLLFLRGASLMGQPFDPDRQRLAGEPFPIARNVIYYGSTLSPSFSVSDNGVLVYQADFPISELKWYDRAGTEVGTVSRPAAYWGTLRLSPDGRRVAAVVFSPENGGTDTWLFDASGRESRRLTFPPEQTRRPVWSPDGTRLAYGRSIPGTQPELATIQLDGSGKEEPLQHAQVPDAPRGLPTDWSHDGHFIAFDSGIPEEGPNVWIADLPANQLVPLLKHNYSEWGTAFSPDGKQIAFVSVQSGRPEVYLQAFDSTPSPQVVGESRQVSGDGACLVRWRQDGRELFYLGTDNKLYAVPVTGVLQFGEPSFLFHVPGTPQYHTARDFQFDVSPDGQRFLMTTTGSVPPPPFTVIQNWQDKFHR